MNWIESLAWRLGTLLYFRGATLDRWSDKLQKWALKGQRGRVLAHDFHANNGE